jgi:3-hydroxybutyryl-CoA dehydrogenase/3-hydroxyacyl-CoA dehydrogenase
MEKIGVLGAGVMGAGIAQVLALAGHEVICADIDQAALDKGEEAVTKGRFGLFSAVERGLRSQEEAEAALSRISFRMGSDALGDRDLVIEAVPERLELKIEVFKDLDRITPSQAILASNSSGLPITALAGATSRPAQVIGWHWASPAPVMRLAEIVRTAWTSDETVETVTRLAGAAGKNPVVVKDQPRTWGYVANRVYAAMGREARQVVAEGVATAEEVDQLMIDCFRWPSGPFGMGRGARSGWN